MNKEDLDAFLKGKLKLESLTPRERKAALKMLCERRDEINHQLKGIDHPKKKPTKMEKKLPVDWSTQFTWVDRRRKIKDEDETRFWMEHWLIHPTGRILAIVECPCPSDTEGPFLATVELVLVRNPKWDESTNYAFFGLEDAKKWCEQIVTGEPLELDWDDEDEEEAEDFDFD